MVKNVLFYSNVHLGDLHLSRCYVKFFLDNFENITFFYTHNQHIRALCDLNINFVSSDLCYKLPQHGDIIKILIDNNECIAFNTWIGAGGLAIGCNFESCYVNFTKYFNYLISNGADCKVNSLPRLLPKIDFSNSCISKEATNEWFRNRTKKTSILVCNNRVMSNQSTNENLNDYIHGIASQSSHIDFYLTNQEHSLLSLQNTFYVEKIIESQSDFSLNDIAYFSTFCDIIVGRGSGPFSFCEIEENLNKIWISFTFEHLQSDSFNGLNTFENYGRYIHTMNKNVLPEILKKEFANNE